MRGLLFRLIPVCLFLVAPVVGQTVNEKASTAWIEGDKAVVRLSIAGDDGGRATDARVELLDVNGKVAALQTRSALRIRSGEQQIEFSFPLGRLREIANSELPWYRLRYRLGDANGIISLSQMLRGLFELRISASNSVLAGVAYRVRVRATSPVDRQPVSGVRVDTNIILDLKGEDESNLKLAASGETDVDGFAVLDFAIPVDARLDGDGKIKVTGRKSGLLRTAEEDLSTLGEDVQVLSLADKPIYQPGQVLNLRGIVLKGAEAKTVLGGADVEFRVTDDDDTLLYRETVNASEYGIAAMSWRIPSNAKLGDYRIEIRDSDGQQIGWHKVKVSRYDLPNFVVTAKPSKPFYLPDDKEAEIEVRADYLFGKPVTKGKVRVVEENRREWNWKEQKYDIDEGAVREGEIDAEGKFVARFDLSETHKELKDDRWDKYDDIKFAAYFTDVTTNRTEQRRFDIRVSREPIHVYLIRGDNHGNSRLPMNTYVSAFYADGTPAECDVEIRASLEDEDKFKTVGRIRTNSFGAGKISMPRPKIGDPDDNLDFRILVKDASGRRGTTEDTVYFDDDDDAIRVTTSQVIHKPGDPIAVRIEATIKTGTVYVDIVSGWTVVESRYTALRNGRAEIQIPYSEKFKGELKVAAYMEEPGDVDDIIESTFGVIYPSRQGISVEASFDKAIYKPNEEASVKFGVIDAVGTAVESALGVVVFDRAVEERARTDADFAGVFRGLSGWLGYGGAFAGVNVKDLNELDLTKPISPEIQLVAELILHDVYYDPKVFHSKSYYDEAKSIFASSVSVQMQPVANAMRSAYELQNHLHATNENGLRSILERYGVDFDDLRDPWGTQYVAVFSIDKTRDIVTIKSLGPDKTLATDDDFTAYTAGFEYFTPIGRAIDTAVNNYNARTGKFIRDEQTLFAELGIRELRDRFGRPYKIVTESDGRYLQLRVQSDGPGDTSNDDFFVWTSRIEFFAGVSKKIAAIQSAVKRAPTTESAFRSSLKEKGVDLDNVRDGNNNPVYVVVDQRSRHWDRVTFETVRDFGDEKSVERRLVTPVTQQIMQFTIRGVGRDGKQGTYDDVTLTQIVHVLSEQAKDDPKPVTVVRPVRYASGTGMIAGTISDASGAAVPAATVTATNSETGHERSVTSNDEGKFLIANLPVGTYTVKVTAPNFKHSIVQNVRVNAGTTTNVDVTVEVGSVDATVDVAASGELDQTTNASATSITSEQLLTLPINARNAMNLIALQPGAAKGVAKSGERDDSVATEQQTSTPRLREYFPETLFWAPEIVTSADGRAEVKFRMADNITTWKMYTIASTKNGRIGVGEKEVAAFQAFFVDLDPPKFLTTGDEIFLPTQVRNYTDKKQDVKVTMSPAGWFHFLDNETQRVAVDSGGSENAVFGFRAIIPTIDGRQRVTATAEAESDAIERPVTVRPNGRQVVHTDSKYFAGSERFEINFPANALPNTRSVELKVYPNLMAHVAESVEGLLQRPYGCGEQTISSTYPNVMILKFAMSGASGTRRISDPVERKARKYLQSGYERLLGYQVADGGFSYWGGKDAADFALTAYALRFLSDASAFITIDPQSVKRAEDWLIRQQQADGSWNKKYHWETAADEARAKSTTTYVARTLAMLKASGKSDLRDAALNKALSYLRTRNAKLDDPYALSLFGLAALDSGDDGLARRIAQKLVSLAKYENSAAYWNLESNTAFNGWGTAGRIETTALVTQLLLRLKSEPGLVGKGMLFLLKNKDRYGVWYSTQTTINVLDTFVASLASSDQKGAQQVQVFVNGDPLTSIEIAPDKLEQIVVDLDGKLSGDRNTLELRSSDRSPLMAQVVANHYLDWKDADASGRTANQSRALRLEYKCDRNEAAIMQEVSCAVEAERIGYRGYGMLLAEIGTPPGADVSRESLQAAMDADRSISRYDILPDRIILYMWSKAGGTKFNFKFRPRYGINAQTPASTVYDYYNPDAQATVGPLRFAVSGQRSAVSGQRVSGQQSAVSQSAVSSQRSAVSSQQFGDKR